MLRNQLCNHPLACSRTFDACIFGVVIFGKIRCVLGPFVRTCCRAHDYNNMRNPKLKDVGRVCACYYCCMPSSPMLLHIYLVWGYACCTPSSPVLLHIIYCPCFSNSWHCHSYILQHFNGNVFTLVYLCNRYKNSTVSAALHCSTVHSLTN